MKEWIAAVMPNLPPAQLHMMAMPYYVGQFVMTWGKHERMLADMLARIRDCNYETLRDRLLDSQVKEYEVEIRKALSEIGDEHPSSPYLKAILAEHVPLRSLRHDIVHGFWLGFGPNEEFILKRKPRKEEDKSREIGLAEVENAWRRLDELGMAVINAGRVAEGKAAI
jgi:hypothetical protein